MTDNVGLSRHPPNPCQIKACSVYWCVQTEHFSVWRPEIHSSLALCYFWLCLRGWYKQIYWPAYVEKILLTKWRILQCHMEWWQYLGCSVVMLKKIIPNVAMFPKYSVAERCSSHLNWIFHFKPNTNNINLKLEYSARKRHDMNEVWKLCFLLSDVVHADNTIDLVLLLYFYTKMRRVKILWLFDCCKQLCDVCGACAKQWWWIEF